MKGTMQEYKTLNDAYDFFNRMLFDGGLPECMITYSRKKGARAYFANDMFQSRNGNETTIDEIAMNPDNFDGRKDCEIISTLVHEMVHTWQAHHGKVSRGGYHNKEWADKMETIGLMPTTTGEEGGKKTGQAVTHYIIDGGQFDISCKKFMSNGARLNWQSYNPEGRKKTAKKKNKIKYTCPSCNANAWGKPEINLMCGDCMEKMEPEE